MGSDTHSQVNAQLSEFIILDTEISCCIFKLKNFKNSLLPLPNCIKICLKRHPAPNQRRWTKNIVFQGGNKYTNILIRKTEDVIYFKFNM